MITKTLENLAETSFREGNDAELLCSGPEYFGAIFESLSTAKQSICIAMYAIWDGVVAGRLTSVLTNRAKSGVAVRLLSDAVGSRAWSMKSIHEMQRAGVDIILHNPITTAKIGSLDLRTHRKLIIVDAGAAFVGGFNFVDVFAGTRSELPWLEYVVRVSGSAVADARSLFEWSWQRSGGTPSTQEPLGLTERGDAAVLLISSPNRSGRRTVTEMHRAVISLARQRLFIRSPFFLPDAEMLASLSDAVSRGVEVRVIVPGKRMAHRVLLEANRNLYGPLLSRGIKLFEYEPAMMHAKTLLVDDSLAIVGSANFDARSASRNEELTLVISAASTALVMASQYQADLRDCAEVKQPIRSYGPLRRIAAVLTPFL